MPDDEEVTIGVPTNALLPAWAEKAGAYLTDRGTLIRIGVFALGAAMATAGIITFFISPAKDIATTVVKAVK